MLIRIVFLIRDQVLRKEIQQERARIVQKMRATKADGESAQRAPRRVFYAPHCDDIIVFEE